LSPAKACDNILEGWVYNVNVGKAMDAYRRQLFRELGITKPNHQYKEIMGRYLRANEFHRINKTTRTFLQKCIDHLPEIEKWRATLSEEDRDAWNGPRAVWDHWPDKPDATTPRKVQADKPAKTEANARKDAGWTAKAIIKDTDPKYLGEALAGQEHGGWTHELLDTLAAQFYPEQVQGGLAAYINERELGSVDDSPRSDPVWDASDRSRVWVVRLWDTERVYPSRENAKLDIHNQLDKGEHRDRVDDVPIYEDPASNFDLEGCDPVALECLRLDPESEDGIDGDNPIPERVNGEKHPSFFPQPKLGEPVEPVKVQEPVWDAATLIEADADKASMLMADLWTKTDTDEKRRRLQFAIDKFSDNKLQSALYAATRTDSGKDERLANLDGFVRLLDGQRFLVSVEDEPIRNANILLHRLKDTLHEDYNKRQALEAEAEKQAKRIARLTKQRDKLEDTKLDMERELTALRKENANLKAENEKLKATADPIFDMLSGDAADAIWNNGDREWALEIYFAMIGLATAHFAEGAQQRRKAWEDAQRDTLGDDWREQGGQTYEEHLGDIIGDKADDTEATKKKFLAMVKLAFHPTSTTEQAIAAIEGSRRWAEKAGVSIISLTDMDYRDLDELILIKLIGPPKKAAASPATKHQVDKSKPELGDVRICAYRLVYDNLDGFARTRMVDLDDPDASEYRVEEWAETKGDNGDLDIEWCHAARFDTKAEAVNCAKELEKERRAAQATKQRRREAQEAKKAAAAAV
jgi:hypothetical protein